MPWLVIIDFLTFTETRHAQVYFLTPFSGTFDSNSMCDIRIAAVAFVRHSRFSNRHRSHWGGSMSTQGIMIKNCISSIVFKGVREYLEQPILRSFDALRSYCPRSPSPPSPTQGQFQGSSQTKGNQTTSGITRRDTLFVQSWCVLDVDGDGRVIN